MRRALLVLTTLGILCFAGSYAQAGGYYHHGHGPYHHGPYHHGRFYGPVVVRPPVVYAPPIVVRPRVVYPPVYGYPYYEPAAPFNFYYQGRGVSVGVGF
jgi:hypothetical protein